mmetsp:Transcript_32561/g.80822  ORF Transcript_32561/g.80822 Transcript_32561/m.80822 type:complete len:282 (-) Transcript_32561:374-1219(-)
MAPVTRAQATAPSQPPPPPPPPPLLPKPKPVCSICLEGGRLMALGCQHSFHRSCLEAQVSAGSPSARLTFAYLGCALCRIPIRRGAFPLLEAHHKLQDQVFAVCSTRAVEDDAIAGLASMNREVAFEAIMQQMAAYHCARCEVVYCGGKAECAHTDIDPSTLLCQPCAWRDARSDHKCRVHGAASAIFKCDCCCSVATFDCSSNHYCDDCHAHVEDGGIGRPSCRGRVSDRCPLSLPHPPNQPRKHSGASRSGFVIGCSACLGIAEHCSLGAVSPQTRERF